MTLRLGLIGLSPGNGHPYSWGAICNGYNPSAMGDCGFPVIPDYLARQDWPSARLPGVQITHVWTQERALSDRIARAALIEHVVNSPADMLGKVDALLLARDDALNHRALAEPFLRAGLPVYIDKPVALSLADFDTLHALQSWPGQIFSCSALRFAREMQLPDAVRTRIGELRLVTGVTPKFWDTYSMHLIDPLLCLLGHVGSPQRSFVASSVGGGRVVGMHWPSGPEVVLTALGATALGPLQLRLHGEDDWLDLTFSDSFSAFRAALAEFIAGIVEGSAQTHQAFNRKAVEILELGRG